MYGTKMVTGAPGDGVSKLIASTHAYDHASYAIGL